METKRNPNDKRNALFLVIIFISLFIIIKKCNDQSSNKKLEAFIYSQQMIEQKLKLPTSANYPIYSDNLVKQEGNIYTIDAYVDAQNSFGAQIRNTYHCILKEENNLFYLQDISIQ